MSLVENLRGNGEYNLGSFTYDVEGIRRMYPEQVKEYDRLKEGAARYQLGASHIRGGVFAGTIPITLSGITLMFYAVITNDLDVGMMGFGTAFMSTVLGAGFDDALYHARHSDKCHYKEYPEMYEKFLQENPIFNNLSE